MLCVTYYPARTVFWDDGFPARFMHKYVTPWYLIEDEPSGCLWIIPGTLDPNCDDWGIIDESPEAEYSQPEHS